LFGQSGSWQLQFFRVGSQISICCSRSFQISFARRTYAAHMRTSRLFHRNQTSGHSRRLKLPVTCAVTALGASKSVIRKCSIRQPTLLAAAEFFSVFGQLVYRKAIRTECDYWSTSNNSPISAAIAGYDEISK
jgi:hypothetical protein